MKLLLLGGTREARLLAERLAVRPGVEATLSLAGEKIDVSWIHTDGQPHELPLPRGELQRCVLGTDVQRGARWRGDGLLPGELRARVRLRQRRQVCCSVTVGRGAVFHF